MIAILTENFGGNWPFWISPRQIMIIPVSHAADAYAQQLQKKFESEFYVDCDLSDLTLNKKVRNAEVSHYNFVIVVGAQEESSYSVNVRKGSKEGKDLLLPVDDAIKVFKALKASRSRENVIEAAQ